MSDRNPTANSSPLPRWTEERVERLLLALFADMPAFTAPSAPEIPTNRGRHRWLVAVAAICLAALVPALSTGVVETSTDEYPLARWVGPLPEQTDPEMNLVAADDSEASSSESDESENESDETAEASDSSESDDSAST